MTIRTLSTDPVKQAAIKDSLVNFDPFIIAHLIKFEKPTNDLPGYSEAGIDPNGFSYITDSPYDIEFDDGSLDSTGTAIGVPMVYRANKVLSIGTINENIQAKASNMSLKLDSSSLGTNVTVSATITKSDANNGVFITDTDLSEAGFQEGDKISITGGHYLIIKSFINEGKSITFTSTVDANPVASSYLVTQSSEELNALLADKNDFNGYTNYINRDVYIYKCHINPETRQIIGEPFLYFKGIISTGSISEKLDSSEVQWGLTSHWGDFLQIKGRITDDGAHRALNASGSSETGALIKEEYSGDYGFLHSNTSLLQAVKYSAVEQESYYREDQSFWGGGTGSMQTRNINVERTTTLDFNLKARQIPLVYGVRKLKSFPVFVDTYVTDASAVYKADVICEGPIASIYDVLVDGTAIICTDESDLQVRGVDELGQPYYALDAPPEQVCFGNKARGDVIEKATQLTGTTICYPPGNIPDSEYRRAEIAFETCIDNGGIAAGTSVSGYGDTGVGLVHEDRYEIPKPTAIQQNFTFHAGVANQAADFTYINLARNNEFKLQGNFDESKAPYWGPSHRLLDTAYVASVIKISDGETQIPDLEYIVRGMNIECHNYDSSYNARIFPVQDTAEHINWILGDEVAIYALSGDGQGTADINTDTQLVSSTRIIDKFKSLETEINSTSLTYRFRWADALDLEDVKGFYMTKLDSENVRIYYYLSTSDTAVHESRYANTSESQRFHVAANVAGTTNGRKITITDSIGNDLSVFQKSFFAHPNAMVRVYTSTSDGSRNYPGIYKFDWIDGTSQLDNIALDSSLTIVRVQLVNVANVNRGLVEDPQASLTEDAYTGMTLKLTLTSDRLGNIVAPYVQVRKITKYLGGGACILEGPWDEGWTPDNDNSLRYSVGAYGDRRPTTNPAMQLLDYMTDVRYGKGLDLDNDINLESFKEAALLCDTRSDVYIVATSAAAAAASVGDLFEYPKQADQSIDNPIRWQGKVKSISEEYTTSAAYKVITFEEVVGKLGDRWYSYNSYEENQLHWHNGYAYTASRDFGTTPTGVGALTSLTLGKVSSLDTLSVDLSQASSNGNPILKNWNPASLGFTASGYSLYDSDDVKYWKYVGWDDNQQRNVTRHQMNQLIDTGIPVFDNINKMLSQFNGILRYSGGRYDLSIEGKKGVIDSVEQISEEDIIGTIKLSDGGLKQSKNFLSASIMDPQNQFESRNITFFNSNYLKQDKGIQKKGQTLLTGITNYFNARMNVEQALNRSRFGLEIQFTMAPKGLLLTAGSIIELTYPRFGYTAKEFRITNLNFKKDGTVDVSAKEHSDSIYKISEPYLDSVDIERSVSLTDAIPDAPTNTRVVSNYLGSRGQIGVLWTNSENFSSATHIVEVYKSTSDNFSDTVDAGSFVPGTFYAINTPGDTDFVDIGSPDNNAGTVFMATGAGTGTGTVNKVFLAGTSDSDRFMDTINTGSGNQTRYYWIRYRVKKPAFNVSGSNFRNVYSLYSPLSSEAGLQGDAYPTSIFRAVQLTSSTPVFTYEADGVGIESGTPSNAIITTSLTNVFGGGIFYVWKKNNIVIPDAIFPSLTYTPPSAITSMPETITCVVSQTIFGETHTFEDSISFTGTHVGAPGAPGLDGQLVKTVNIYRKNNATIVAASGTFADPLAGNTDWSLSVPALTADGDIVYVATRTFSDDGLTPQDAAWSTPAVYSTRVDGVNGDPGDPGDEGLRTIQGYLYYEKTTAGAPLAPSGSTYTFSTGDVSGGTGATEVLALSATSAVDKWTNEPRTQDPASTNTHYTVRYSGTEAAAGSTTITVTYASIVQYTNFTGIVTFENGDFLENGSTITTIDGGNIDAASQITVGTGTNKAGLVGEGTLGTDIRIFAGDTVANRATAPFRVDQDGVVYATNAEITGEVVASTLVMSTSDELVNLKAQSVLDDSITLASLNTEVINFINSSAATYGGSSPGDYKTDYAQFTNLTPAPSPLITLPNFNHGIVSPKATLAVTIGFFSPTDYSSADRTVEFQVFYKKSADSTWFSGGFYSTFLTKTIFPQNPDFTKFYYSRSFSTSYVYDTQLVDNTEYDFKLELASVAEAVESGASVWFTVQEDANPLNNASTLDFLDSTQFLRSDENATMFGSLNVTGSVSINSMQLVKAQETLTTITQTSIYSFWYGHDGAKFIITATDGNKRQITELLVTHNNVTAIAVEYASIDTDGVLATYEVDINGTDVRILATGASANSTTYLIASQIIT